MSKQDLLLIKIRQKLHKIDELFGFCPASTAGPFRSILEGPYHVDSVLRNWNSSTHVEDKPPEQQGLLVERENLYKLHPRTSVGCLLEHVLVKAREKAPTDIFLFVCFLCSREHEEGACKTKLDRVHKLNINFTWLQRRVPPGLYRRAMVSFVRTARMWIKLCWMSRVTGSHWTCSLSHRLLTICKQLLPVSRVTSSGPDWCRLFNFVSLLV